MKWREDAYWLNTGQGIEVENTGVPHDYVGLTLRYSIEEYEEREMVDLVNEQAAKVQELIRRLEEDGYKIGKTVERYDVAEHPTGDLLIMYRVPVNLP